MTTQIYAGVREILTAPDWEPVSVTDHGAFFTIAGLFRGTAHSGSRKEWDTLAIDLDRIAREVDARIAEALAEKAAAEAIPEPVVEVEPEVTPEPEPIVIEEAPATPQPEPEPEPNADLLHEIDALKDLVAEQAAELERLREDRAFPAMTEPLSAYGDVGEGANLTTADLTEEVIAGLTKAKRKKFTELLNVELAELQQERGGPREDLKRENEIEALLGLFARVGEM